MDQGSRLARTAAKTGAIIGGAAAGAAAGWAAYSALFVSHKVLLRPALSAARHEFTRPQTGKLSYYTAGFDGRPLVLLHSINAAASAYEVEPLFERYRASRRVYALDLPGFGFSDRSDREYTPELYVRAIIEFLESQVGAAADVVALSLTSEFAARAALARPEFFRSLTMVSPTGFDDRSPESSDILRRALSLSVWARPMFDLLVSRQGIAYFLRKSFAGPIDPGLAEYAYATAHQPGARYAPVWFISGALFTPGVRGAYYDRLRLPVLVIYNEDGYVTFDRLPDFVSHHANWTATRIPGTKGLPHFEEPAETTAALDRFWAERMAA